MSDRATPSGRASDDRELREGQLLQKGNGLSPEVERLTLTSMCGLTARRSNSYMVGVN